MFLCTGNTYRSQMAEGFGKFFGKGRFEVFSAGIKAEGFVNLLAIKVMNEVGIDISEHKSKVINNKLLNQMDLIVTLCSNAEETCPVTPSKIKRIHIPVNDPSKIIGTEEEVLNAFRKARDETKEKVLEIISQIEKKEK